MEVLETKAISDHNAVILEVVSDTQLRKLLTKPYLIKDQSKLKRNAISALKTLLHSKFCPNRATEALQKKCLKFLEEKQKGSNKDYG